MHWVAPTEKDAGTDTVEKRLWVKLTHSARAVTAGTSGLGRGIGPFTVNSKDRSTMKP